MFRKVFYLLRMLNPFRALRWIFFVFFNQLRRFRKVDYVSFVLPTSMEALPEERNWLRRRIQGDSPLSLADLERALQRIAEDPRPQGVILYIRGFSMPLADLQTLRDSMKRLRERGKRVVCFAQSYDTASYYVASAADDILLQPGGDLLTLGLRQNALFLKDALSAAGIQIDAVAISPYKTAFDRFTRQTISPEAREQLEWLLDSRYKLIINGIAEERKQDAGAITKMIDCAPHVDSAALEAGYVDAVINEEGVAEYLDVNHILPWKRVDKVVRKQWRRRQDRYVALVRIGGTIIPGESRKPPVNIPIPIIGGEMSGDLTVVQQVRRLMADPRAAAVILFVDSPGGSGTASEAMASALKELAKGRPLVVYMNNVAASGGYYVSTPARWIVAQPGTITGSIGVLAGKPVTQSALEKLNINRLEFTRGENVTLLSDQTPFTDEQREQMQQAITHFYDQFTSRVAESREMTQEAVDAVSGGRVWTGEQALEHGLVDELGDLRAALAKARQLADLPEDAPLVFPRGDGDPLPPQLAEQANPAAALQYLYESARLIFDGRAQFLMPFTIGDG